MSVFKLMHPRFVEQFENDARTQVKFHVRMTWFWAATMLVAPLAFMPHDMQSLMQLLILEVSLYANWSTEFGALAASQASLKADSKEPPIAVG